MKCLHCGYCCLNLFVVIVVNPDLGIIDTNLKAIDCLKERCPHLRGNKPGHYSCAIHHYDWFSETPCAQYQSHEFYKDQLCHVGKCLTYQHTSKMKKHK